MGLVEQIRSEQKRLGWSTQQLLDKSGLKIERSSLHRKLAGDTPITADECQALATALGIQLVWPIAEGRVA
jgi:transcriptional regulator with XRE-family HTH domain